MSLTQDDLQQIRLIVKEEVEIVVHPIVRAEVEKSTKTLSGKLEALESDIKEIYFMITKLELRSKLGSDEFNKRSLKEQTLQLNEMLLALAKRQDIVLPR